MIDQEQVSTNSKIKQKITILFEENIFPVLQGTLENTLQYIFRLLL
jgi:hypothetical protein